MSKKLILMLVVLVFLCKFGSVEAQVKINEFVSDPSSGSEWIELLNTSSSEINLEGWQWSELASPGTDTEHESSLKGLSGTIPANGFFVFEMSSALNNLGDSIGLYNGTNLEDRVTFGKVNNYSKDLEFPAKGKSGALISGTWKVNQEPTKNQANPSSGSSNNDEENISNDEEEEEISEPDKQATPKLQKSKVQIVSTKLAYVGISFSMEGSGTGTLGEKLTRGVFYWNFDDGDFREVKAVIKDKFTHTYFYPGDYTVTLEYYPDIFTDTPDTTTETVIKVLEPKILISKVGEASDFFIEIANETGHEANISNWVLASDSKVFTFPKNTILSSSKKMIISPRVSGFSIEDKNSLKVMTPEREVVFEYISFTVPGTKITEKKNPPISTKEEKSSVVAKDLIATSISGQAEKDSNSASSSSSFAFIIFLLFIGASVGGVYFIRRRRNMSPTPADDFEILDE